MGHAGIPRNRSSSVSLVWYRYVFPVAYALRLVQTQQDLQIELHALHTQKQTLP